MLVAKFSRRLPTTLVYRPSHSQQYISLSLPLLGRSRGISSRSPISRCCVRRAECRSRARLTEPEPAGDGGAGGARGEGGRVRGHRRRLRHAAGGARRRHQRPALERRLPHHQAAPRQGGNSPALP